MLRSVVGPLERAAPAAVVQDNDLARGHVIAGKLLDGLLQRRGPEANQGLVLFGVDRDVVDEAGSRISEHERPPRGGAILWRNGHFRTFHLCCSSSRGSVGLVALRPGRSRMWRSEGFPQCPARLWLAGLLTAPVVWFMRGMGGRPYWRASHSAMPCAATLRRCAK